MDNFQVYRGANEPTAYFLCAGRELDKFPKKENERLFYGIFDFGGGTTDFSFGICKYIGESSNRHDYEIIHFGDDGDKYSGGENILKNLAFEIFKKKYSILTQISNNINNLNDSTEEIDRIIKNRKKEKLLKCLQIIDKDIIDIYINDEEIFVEKETLKEFIPISSIGDGMVLALDIITSLILADDFKVILIDEIERGIYYKNYRKLSEIIIELCKNNQNIQLFITTHSKEFLEVFNESLLEFEKDNFSLFSLRNKKEKLDFVHYTSEELKDTLEMGWDPR